MCNEVSQIAGLAAEQTAWSDPADHLGLADHRRANRTGIITDEW